MRNKDFLKFVSKMPCMACPMPSLDDMQWVIDNIEEAPRRSDPHHVTTVAAGGTDEADNVMPLCRKHHTEWHAKGGKTMAQKYQGIYLWLQGAERTEFFE